MLERPIPPQPAGFAGAGKPLGGGSGRAGWMGAVAAPAAVMLVPVAGYFWYLQHFWVDIIARDEWDVVPLLQALDRGQLTLGMLWAQHYENRMALPYLLILGLAKLSRFDTRWEMVLGGALLVAAFLVLLRIFVGRGKLSAWALTPVAFIWFSWAQSRNILWGFQLAWPLVLVLLCVMVAALSREAPSGRGFALAAVAAAAASISSVSGLFLWPCGLYLLLVRRHCWWARVSWVLITAAVTGVYLYRFQFNQTGASSTGYLTTHMVAAVRFFLLAAGNVVAGMSPHLRGGTSQGTLDELEAAGVVVVLLAVATVAIGIRVARRDPLLHPAIALILFGLIFDLTLVLRLERGILAALPGQYVSYNLTLLTGVWLVTARIWQRSRRPEAALVLAVAGVMILCQVGVGTATGLRDGRLYQADRQTAQDLLANYRIAPPALISSYLHLRWQVVPPRAAFLDHRHLSVFAIPVAAKDRRRGIVPGRRPGPGLGESETNP